MRRIIGAGIDRTAERILHRALGRRREQVMRTPQRGPRWVQEASARWRELQAELDAGCDDDRMLEAIDEQITIEQAIVPPGPMERAALARLQRSGQRSRKRYEQEHGAD